MPRTQAGAQPPTTAATPPTPPSPAHIDNSQRLEVETVEVGPFSAIPTEIKRKPGKFILMIVNHSGNPNALFAVDPATPAPGNSAAAHLITLGSISKMNAKHNSANIFNAPAGQFNLINAATGKILCKFVIQ